VGLIRNTSGLAFLGVVVAAALGAGLALTAYHFFTRKAIHRGGRAMLEDTPGTDPAATRRFVSRVDDWRRRGARMPTNRGGLRSRLNNSTWRNYVRIPDRASVRSRAFDYAPPVTRGNPRPGRSRAASWGSFSRGPGSGSALNRDLLAWNEPGSGGASGDGYHDPNGRWARGQRPPPPSRRDASKRKGQKSQRSQETPKPSADEPAQRIKR
jgi:hypothetical protein